MIKIGDFKQKVMLLCFINIPTNQNCIKKEASNILDSITRKCYYTNNPTGKHMKKEKTYKKRMCNKMSINTADFAALAVYNCFVCGYLLFRL